MSSSEYIKVLTDEKLKKEARYLSGKLSYRGAELFHRVARQQIMIREQNLKVRRAELNFLDERAKLLRFQTDLDIMFLVQDINRKKSKKNKV